MKTFQKTYQQMLALNEEKGFTLIELLVVIAILGILAAGLLFTIDPLDKIRAANDATALQTVTQIGRANDAVAVNNNNAYVYATDTNSAASALQGQGELKTSSANMPTGYTSGYATTSTSCTLVSQNCKDYAVYVLLQSKKYVASGKPLYVYSDGQSCFKASTAVPTTPLSGSACP